MSSNDEMFWHLMNTDWRAPLVFYGFWGLSAIYIQPENKIWQWIVGLAFNAALVAFIVGTAGFVLDTYKVDWSYTRFVWDATYPLWILVITLCIIAMTYGLTRDLKKDPRSVT